MANIVQGGLFVNDAINHGLVNMGTINEIKQSNASFAKSLGSATADWFTKAAHNAFEQFGGNAVRSKLEAAMRRNDAFWTADTYTPIDSLTRFQNAKPKNREVIMCHNSISRLHEEQRCHAYGGDFRHHEGHGEENHMWRMINQGEEVELSNGETGWATYADDWEPGEELTKWEAAYARITHDSIDFLLGNDVDTDITDPLNCGW